MPIDIEELLKVLPKIIRENDTVKGAIITALSGVVATREDIQDLIRQMDERFEAVDRRFEAMDRRFEAMDKRFEALQAQMNKRFEAMEKRFEAMDKRFEAMDKRFEAMQVQMDRRFDAMQVQMDRRFDAMQVQMDKRFKKVFRRLKEITIGAGESFERFCKEVIKSLLAAEGTPVPFVESGRHFVDADHELSEETTDVEIDLFCPDPPVLGEVTYKMEKAGKLDEFLEKAEFIERTVLKKPARKYFCTLEVDPEIRARFQAKAAANQVHVITKAARD